jgi:glycosyltransferase involved in cell wall biosynthesis
MEEDVPDADIVIATWWETAEWVSHFSARKGIKVYFIQHHEVFDYLPRARVEATYRLPLHKVVVAPWLVDVMRANYDDEPLAIAPPGVDTKLFFAPPRHKQVLPTVGLMYSPLYWKGCDLCLEAFRLASRWIPELRLIVFGEVFPPIECPLPENSQFFHRPSQHELRCIYASCDAWLFGSRSEGFGLPLLEAMACRTPIIGTPTGAAPDLLKEGGGLLVDSGDPTAIAHAIAHMCQLSDAEWQGYSNAAYEKATSYTWQDATNRFEAALIEATRQS